MFSAKYKSARAGANILQCMPIDSRDSQWQPLDSRASTVQWPIRDSRISHSSNVLQVYENWCLMKCFGAVVRTSNKRPIFKSTLMIVLTVLGMHWKFPQLSSRNLPNFPHLPLSNVIGKVGRWSEQTGADARCDKLHPHRHTYSYY